MKSLTNLVKVGEKLKEGMFVIDKNNNLLTAIDKDKEECYLAIYKIKKGSAKLERRQKITQERYKRYKSQVTK